MNVRDLGIVAVLSPLPVLILARYSHDAWGMNPWIIVVAYVTAFVLLTLNSAVAWWFGTMPNEIDGTCKKSDELRRVRQAYNLKNGIK